MADDLMDQAMRLHLAGRHAESEALYRQIAPDSAKAKHYLGFLLQQTGRLEEALELIEASTGIAENLLPASPREGRRQDRLRWSR